MDQRSKEMLAVILEKSPKELTEDEILFLRGRRGYLKESQLEEYKTVLKDNQTSSKEETVKQNGESSTK